MIHVAKYIFINFNQNYDGVTTYHIFSIIPINVSLLSNMDQDAKDLLRAGNNGAFMINNIQSLINFLFE